MKSVGNTVGNLNKLGYKHEHEHVDEHKREHKHEHEHEYDMGSVESYELDEYNQYYEVYYDFNYEVDSSQEDEALPFTMV